MIPCTIWKTTKSMGYKYQSHVTLLLRHSTQDNVPNLK